MDNDARLTLYQYSRKPQDEQLAMYRMLEAEIATDELANRPTLVKKYYLGAMYHVMAGRTRRHGRNADQPVPGSILAGAAQPADLGDADLGTRFHAEALDALEARKVEPHPV